MRSVLGSILLVVALFGADVQVSTTTPFYKEPVLLTFTYSDPEPQKIVWVKFSPVKDPAIESHFLKKTVNSGSYTFSYLLFPLKEGEITMHYILKVKKSAVEVIQQDILGTGYEQTNPIEGKVYTIDVAPTIFHVKHVKPVDLYGDFHITLDVDKNKVESYEPLYVSVRLRGVGYVPQLEDPLQIPGVKILKDKPQKSVQFTPKGAEVDYIFRYAVVSDHNFTIPALRLKEFDFARYKDLTTPAYTITVIRPKNLVDKENNPLKIEPTFEKFQAVLLYVAVFLAGVLSGVILYLLWRRKEIEDILLARNHKELLALLVVRYPNCFAKEKEALEREENLQKIKKEIIKGLKQCKSSKH
ncbi:BatD family protein [Nitratiruptor tergarcus]|uniref:Oxygen tolerance n=1 Tax=Nitratiruptor tergarcus DSM 16512 TaxID=1069081 RepID=A0A1W1WSD1_9BACT|nr:BatD family protein [Nitratiruptor tergarcus]SMC08623.1 Oxygen tolerance [Nitratiruptor tergarcus DSM 16512]